MREDIDSTIDQVDPTTRKTLTRLLREATTNAVRYARPGSECVLAIRRVGSTVTFDMSNPMPDVARRSEHSTGFGLVGLDERVRITGGQFSASSVDGVWHVSARLPTTAQVDLRPAHDADPIIR